MSIVRWKLWRAGVPERHEFVRETASFFINHNGTRVQKHSRYYAFYSTLQEAELAMDKRNRAEKERRDLRRIEGMGPELLSALKELRDAISAGSYEDPSHDRIYSALTASGELIKKAEGERP